jgi:hypothetical protein
MIRRYKRVLLLAILAVVTLQALPSSARWADGRVVNAEIRHAGGKLITIAASTTRPYGFASLKGRHLTIECIDARRRTDVLITYNPLCPVCVFYVPTVAMRGRLANGETRWVAMASLGAGYITVDIRKTPSSGACGAPRQDTLHFPTKFYGYLLVG